MISKCMFCNQWLIYMRSYFFSQLCEGKPTTLLCIAPALLPEPSLSDINQKINYTVIMDDAMGPDITEFSLRLSLLPNPFFIGILESNRVVPTGINSTITITVCHRGQGLLVVQINNPFFMTGTKLGERRSN